MKENTGFLVVTVVPITDSTDDSSVEVNGSGKTWRIQLPKTVTDSFQNGFEEKLKWLVENYAADEPFEGTAATGVTDRLRQYRAELLSSLQLRNALLQGRNAPHVLLEVHDVLSAPARFRRIHWEALEYPQLHSKKTLPISGLTVRRVVISTSTMVKDDSKPSSKWMLPQRPRLLAVTARRPGVKDIPHRLVTRPMLRILKGLDMKNDFEILRPPTFERLINKLERQEAGFYPIVHLDVHGSVDDKGSTLHFIEGFVQGKRIQFEADCRSAEEVGKLLAYYGVKMVILNACESAKESEDPSLNLARILVQKGIDIVVAMAYKVLQTAASIFTQAFYYQLLKHRSSPIVAVKFARQQLLQQRGRNTKFGAQVNVDDYFVPVIYESRDAASAMENLQEFEASLTTSGSTEYSAWLGTSEAEQDVLIGREADLLSLEMSLYYHVNQDKKKDGAICRIVGEAGVGKSSLIDDAVQWWRDTGMIRDCIWLKDIDRVTEQLTVALRLNMEANKSKIALLKDIRKIMTSSAKEEMPYLFIFDDAVSSSAAQEMKDGPQLGQIFLGSGSLVIVASRRPEKWQTALFHYAEPLQSLSRDHAIELGAKYVKRSGLKDLQAMSRLELEALANISKLAFGNPLALRLLMHDFCQSEFSPEAYFMRLMRGHSIGIENCWLNSPGDRALSDADESDTRRSSSIREMSDFLQRDTSRLLWLLLPFWFRVPQKELRDYCCWYVESYWEDDDESQNQKPEEQQPAFPWNLWGRFPQMDAASTRLTALMFSSATNFPGDSIDPPTNTTAFRDEVANSSKEPDNPFDDDDGDVPYEHPENPFSEDFAFPLDDGESIQDGFNNPFPKDDSDTAVSEPDFAATQPQSHHPASTVPATSWFDNIMKNVGEAVATRGGAPKVRTGAISPSLFPGVSWMGELDVSAERRAEYTAVWAELSAGLERLVERGFATPYPSPSDGDSTARPVEYYILHPLLPLLLRNNRVRQHDKVRNVVRNTYARFITYRIKSWPLGELHAHEGWKQGPVKTIDAEFLNFLAAASLALEGPVGFGSRPLASGTEWDELGSQEGDQVLMAYTRIAQLVQLALVLQKGILEDYTRHAVVAAFWEEGRQVLLPEIRALKRPDTVRIQSLGDAISYAASRLRDAREQFPDSTLWSPVAKLSLFIGQTVVLLVWLIYQTVVLTWRLVVLLRFLWGLTAMRVLVSLAEFSSWLLSTGQERLRTAMRTNSRAPLLSLGTEVIAMVMICNLFSYYEGLDDSKLVFYHAEARALVRARTRIPVLDIAVRMGSDALLDLLEGGLRTVTERDVQAMLERRQQLYGGLALLGHDVQRYLTPARNLPGLNAAVSAVLGLRNSLSSPYEAVLQARAESMAALEAYPDPEGVERAREILRKALDRELHEGKATEDREDKEGKNTNAISSGKGGALAPNVVYLHRALSEVSRRAGDWQQALWHWNQAAQWEERGGRASGKRDVSRGGGPSIDVGAGTGSGGSARSWRRVIGDTATLWGLRAMASAQRIGSGSGVGR